MVCRIGSAEDGRFLCRGCTVVDGCKVCRIGLADDVSYIFRGCSVVEGI